jgi:hypothetical protein
MKKIAKGKLLKTARSQNSGDKGIVLDITATEARMQCLP